MSDDFSMLDLFREEVRQHTATLSQELLALEQGPAHGPRLEALMRAAHSIKGAARIVNIDPAVRLAHDMEEVFVAAQQGQRTLTPADVDVLLRATDLLLDLSKAGLEDPAAWSAQHEAAIAELRQALTAPPAPQPAGGLTSPVPQKPAGEIVGADLRSALGRGQSGGLAPQVPKTGDLTLAARQGPNGALTPESAEAVVRVTAQSLDRLVGLAGESLVQARWLQPFTASLLGIKKQQDRLAALLESLQAAFSQGPTTEQAPELLAAARAQEQRCRQLLLERIGEVEDHAAAAEDHNSRLYREVIVSRMRPFADGAQGFPRLVRDLARQLGKQVRLEILGASTEVDRDILDRLESPLNHLLRNAIDHGIELPAERQARGKPPTGLVRVEARHRAGTLAITVSDDGRGIDLDALRRKVVERGLTNPSMAESLQETELLEFLFLPGFSTARSVTEVSGRGVGLDVVQDTLRKIGGSVRISSRLGQGASFHLHLPITLSVVRAVIVMIAGEPYAFPHNRIDRLIRVPRSEVHSLEHRQYATIDGQHVGLVLAAQLLELPAAPSDSDELMVLLLSDGSGQYGLIVHSFRSEQDLVVRPLDPRLGRVPNISAAAILDDGSPVLIADVEDLIRSMDQLIQSGALQRCAGKQRGEEERKRVLVVDDSLTVREVERHLLEGQGYEVAVAVDGKEGWNLVRGQRFDLVISDVDMPRMNGLELLRSIRSEEALRDVPVIIVSYKDREEERLRGMQLGANYYLTKSSFHNNTFLQAVQDLIGEA